MDKTLIGKDGTASKTRTIPIKTEPSEESLQLAVRILNFPPALRSYALRLIHAMTSGRISHEDLAKDMDWLIWNRHAGNTKALDNWLRRKLIRAI